MIDSKIEHIIASRRNWGRPSGHYLLSQEGCIPLSPWREIPMETQVYLSTLKDVFLPRAKCISPNCKIHFPILLSIFVLTANWRRPSGHYPLSQEGCIPLSLWREISMETQYICHCYKMYFSIWQNVFIQIAKCISPYCSVYLSKLQTRAGPVVIILFSQEGCIPLSLCQKIPMDGNTNAKWLHLVNYK